MSAPLGQTVWVGPISGATICGFEGEKTAHGILIAAWKSVDVKYGECYEMMLMDESVFDELFASHQDVKSTWHLFGADQTEIWYTSRDAYPDPEQLIGKSNSGEIFRDADGLPVCAFSMTINSTAWTLVRMVSMENYENLANRIVVLMTAFALFVLLVALTAYELWLKRFVRQFNSMLNGIIRMGQGELDQVEFEPSSISEFERMQQEINKTSIALTQQMEMIRRMEREQTDGDDQKID